MRALGLTVVVLVLAATACGASQRHRFETADQVAALLRHTWGSTKGSPTFDYKCTKIDDRVFTCVAKDASDMVRVASFDVVCDASKCTWTDYPAYVG